MAFGTVNAPGVSGVKINAAVKEAVKEAAGEAKALLAAHNAGEESHGDLRRMIAALDSRISLLELACGANTGGTAFSVGFESLEAVEARGVWNTALKRIEF